ncbi:MAG: protein kinase [Planctomycetota bacterium]|nr:protein kinase [Planctomycetota bacterium]
MTIGVINMDDDLFDELILRWDEFREQGRKLTPDALMATAQESGLLPKRMSPAEREALLEKLTKEIGIHANFPRPEGPVPPIRFLTEYDTVRFHDRGGLGVVSLAFDPTLEREIAIKCISSNLVDDPASQERFRREALITAKLEHPGVVPIHGFGYDKEGNPCYAMKFIEGQTLGAAIQELHLDRKSSRNKADRIRRYRRLITQFVSVCRTVAFAHSRQFIHRDLKPANIMLGEYGETIIFDWGLAKSLSKSSAPSEPAGSEQDGKLPHASSPVQESLTDDMVGSPGYTSPEQARNDPDIGPAADIFALGATLYTILAGRSPKRLSSSKVFWKEISCWDKTTSPRVVNHDVPKPLDAICRKAMEFAPVDRYSSAENLAVDTEAWLADSRVSAHEDRWYERAARWARHHLAWIVSGVVAMIIAIAVSAFFFLAERNARTAEGVARNDAERNAGQLEIALQNETTAKQATDDLNQRLTCQLAVSLIERGAVDCSSGHPDRGVAYFARAYRELAKPESPTAATALRASAFRLLAAWARELGEPLLYDDRLLPNDWPPSVCTGRVQFSPEGGQLLMVVGKLVYLWDATTGEPIGEPMRHDYDVSGVCFSPDGEILMMRSNWDRTVRIWDTATTKLIGEGPKHEAEVTAMCCASDGKTAATGDAHGTVHVWHISTGRTIGQSLKDEAAIAAVNLTPDSKRTLTQNSNDTCRLWDVTSGLPIGEPSGHDIRQNSRHDSPPIVGGDRILAATDHNTISGNYRDGSVRILKRGSYPLMSVGEPLQHEGEVLIACFSADGKQVLTGGADRTARLWDVDTAKPIGEPLQHNARVAVVCFSPDGKTIATGSEDMTARLWDAATGKAIGEPLQHQGEVLTARFSADGSKLLTKAADKTARLWDVATTRQIIASLTHDARITFVDFSPDEKEIVTFSEDMAARLWDAATGKAIGEPLQHEGKVLAVCFSPDGRKVLTGSGDQTARLWDAETAKLIAQTMKHAGEVKAVSFSTDGRTLLTEDYTGKHVWEATTCHPEVVLRDCRPTTALISPDGLTVLTLGHQFGGPRIWDATTGKLITDAWSAPGFVEYDGSYSRLDNACFSPDGRMVVTVMQGGVTLYDARTGEIIKSRTLSSLTADRPTLVKAEDPRAVCVSPDGLTVAAANGKRITVLGIDGSNRCKPLWHEAPVRTVSFTADNRMLIVQTDSSNAISHLWDVVTGELLWKPTKSLSVDCVSPDGWKVVTTSHEGLVCLSPTTASTWTNESTVHGEALGRYHRQRNFPTVAA